LQEEAGRAFTAAGEAVGAADANRAAAMVYLELGMWAEAATVLQRSADAGEVALSDARLDPEVKARTIEVAHAQQALALCLVHLGRNAEAAVAADRARARRLRSIPRMSDPGFRIVRAGDPQLADEYLSIQTSIRAAEIEEMQIRIRHRKGGLERLSVLTDELSAARAKRRAITERMRAVPGVAELLMPVVTLDRIRAALPLAAWAVYIIPSPYGGVAIAIGPDQVIAVQLPSLTHRAVSRRLRSITEAYDVIRGTSERPPDPRGRTAWSAEIEGIGKWLWQVCMGPILAACPGAERLVILAANGLDFLPLHAAWRLGADGVREYAIDCVQISYAPCSDLMPAPELVRDSLAGDSLAVADPAPTSEIPLRGARIEGVAISNALGSSTLLAGPEASIEAVAQLLPKMDVIHFACHARTEVGIPYSSFLLLACNGRLTVSDVVDLNLDRRPSVFLSACETNLHDFERADEVQSLSAAFLAAGARDVISTLWTVEDVSSTILALMFYDRRRAGLGGAAALRYAQRWLRDTSKPTKLNVLAAMAWIPPEVRNDVVDSLTFSSEDHSRPEHWAAHVYSGP